MVLCNAKSVECKARKVQRRKEQDSRARDRPLLHLHRDWSIRLFAHQSRTKQAH